MSQKLEMRLILSDRHQRWKRSSKLGRARMLRMMRGKIGNYQNLEGFESGSISAVLCLEATSCSEINVIGENKAIMINMEDLNTVNMDHSLGGRLSTMFRSPQFQEKRAN